MVLFVCGKHIASNLECQIAKIRRRSLVSSSLHCIHYSFKFVNTGSEISLQKDFRSINDDVRRVNEHQGTLTV